MFTSKSAQRLASVILVLSILLFGFQSPQTARAAGPWYVANTGDDSNDCLSPGTPCATINAAIGKATAGDTIKVATGTYIGSGYEVVLINKNITLSGGWNSTFTVQNGVSTIDGQNTRRGVVNSSEFTINIDRFNIQNGFGGGLITSGNTTVSNSSIHDNSSGGGDGGGIENGGNSTLTLINSTVSNNVSVNGSGGGIFTYGDLIIKNTTISNNSAGTGGGIKAYFDTNVQIENSILAGNIATNGPNCKDDSNTSFVSLGNNIIDNITGCSISAASGDQFNVNPELGDFLPTQGYQPLLSGSPAINTGNSATCPSTDQRGLARVGTCDIGAYEYTTPGSAANLWIVSGSDQRTAPLIAFPKPLKAAVLDSQGSPVPGVNVTFTAPASGASGTFAITGTNTTSVLTNEGGTATTSTFTANNQQGSYVVAVSSTGLTAVNFSLQNVAWYVSTSGNDTNSCASPANPCATINGAINKSPAEDMVLVATGTYTGTGTDVVVLLDKNISLLGGWDASFSTQSGAAIIDGQGARPVIGMSASTISATIDHFVIQNGLGNGVINSGSLTLNYSTVSGNTASGISNGSEGTLIMNNSSVHNNAQNGFGGGISNNGILILSNSAIINNSASGGGGGIDTFYGTVTINNSTISGNTGSSQGGGIRMLGTNLTINNSTITNNSSSAGGGIHYGSYGTINLRNSILANNTASMGPDCNGEITSTGYNLIGNNSNCIFTPTTGDLVGTGANPINPLLAPLQNNGGPTFTHALLAGSPALDAGNPATPGSGGNACLGTDQRGVTRPQGSHCDIGAYELISWFGGTTITSDQNVVAVGRPHVGAEVMTYGGSAAGNLNAYVPMLFKDAFGGSYDSALYVQNVDESNTANITIKFYDNTGAETHSMTDTLAPLASKGYWLPGIAALGTSWVGGVKVESDVNIVAVGRPHIGGQVMTYNGFASGSQNAYVPMLFKDAFGGSYDSALYIQNVDSNTANITIKFYDNNGVQTHSLTDTLAPLASKGYWLPGITQLGSSWIGGVKVESDVDIVTVGRPHIGTQITTYNGFSGSDPEVSVPMLFKKAFGGGSYNAALYVQNTDAVNEATVTVKYYDTNGSLTCTVNDSLPALAIRGYWSPSVSCLPDGWIGGALVSSDKNIVALGRPHVGNEVTAYAGFFNGSLNAYVPMLFRDAFGGSYDSALYLQNTNLLADATVTLKFYDGSGQLSCSKQAIIPAGATSGFWLPTLICD